MGLVPANQLEYFKKLEQRNNMKLVPPWVYYRHSSHMLWRGDDPKNAEGKPQP
jgi:hypothetical protein